MTMETPHSSMGDAEDAGKALPSFGDLFRSVRVGRGLTQTAMAEIVNQSTSLVSLIESGQRRPTRKLLEALKTGLALSDCPRLSEQEATDLWRAAGFPTDELEQAIKQVLDIVQSLVPAEEAERDVMRSDITALVYAWRDLFTGKRHFLAGDMDKAWNHFAAMAEHPEYSPTLISYVNASLADVAVARGELIRAEQFIQKAQSIMQTLPSQRALPLRAEIDAIQGMMAARQGRYQAAAAWMDKSKARYATLLDPGSGRAAAANVGMAKSFIRMAFLASLQGEPAHALEYCEKAESYNSRVTLSETDRIHLRIMAQRAWAMSQLARFPEARELHARARDLHERIGDAYGVAKNWLYLGDDCRMELDADVEATESANTSSVGDRRQALLEALAPKEAQVLAAYNSYQQAIKRFGEVNERIHLGRGLRSLGEVLRYWEILHPDQGHYLRALHSLNRALTLESEIGQGRRIPSILESLARLEWDHGSLANAAAYYEDAIASLKDPRVSSTDAAGQKLLTRCRASLAILRDAIRASSDAAASFGATDASEAAASGTTESDSELLSRLGAGQWNASDAEGLADASLSGTSNEVTALLWREVCQQLTQEIAAAIQAGNVAPMATSDTAEKWLAVVSELETEEGPRIIAQNPLSSALTSTVPAGYPPDAATRHARRWDSLREHVRQADAQGDTPAYRDLCCRRTVESRLQDPALGTHCQQQIDGAIELAESFPAGYALYASIYELPLGFAIKGERVMIKMPAHLAPGARSLRRGVATQGGILCYCIDDNPELAQKLARIFDRLVELTQAGMQPRREGALDWLKRIANHQPERWVDAAGIQPM